MMVHAYLVLGADQQCLVAKIAKDAGQPHGGEEGPVQKGEEGPRTQVHLGVRGIHTLVCLFKLFVFVFTRFVFCFVYTFPLHPSVFLSDCDSLSLYQLRLINRHLQIMGTVTWLHSKK